MITQYALRNKNLTPLLLTILCACCALTTSVHAQAVHIPDPNLRQAVSEALNVPAGSPITETDMRQLTSLNAAARQITDLTGLEHATSLTDLRLGENPIRDISPLMHLTQLAILRLNDVWGISDISALGHLTQLNRLDLDRNLIVNVRPLAGLTALITLDLRFNQIQDVSPLVNLTQLTQLLLNNNQIEDVRPLANLTQLEVLHIQWNSIADHSPLDGLSLHDFLYDQTCDMPPPPLAPRVKNRTYPSIVARWGPHNPELHDLWFDALPHGLSFQETSPLGSALP